MVNSLRHTRNTRYEWLAEPYSTGTCTPQESAKLAWRTGEKGLKDPLIGEDVIVDIIEIGTGTFIFYQIGKGVIKKGTKEIGEKCLEKIETKMIAPKKKLSQYIPKGPMKEKRIGHTFKLHGSHNTHELMMRAKGSGLPQGQWLDDAAAEKFIAERLDQLKNGAKTFKLPDDLGRIIYPDGTFKPATEVRLVPSKSGVETAYPKAKEYKNESF